MANPSEKDRSDGCRLLITAGPTHEPLDAVRYLGNRSSGRLGVALAAAAARRGMPVTLLLGPACVQPPVSSQVRTLRFRTTGELQRRLGEQWADHDVLIMAAAVADFRPRHVDPRGKIRRGPSGLVLELEPTPDLLTELAGRRRADQTIIGFALEPAEELAAAAREKLRRKGVDAMVANPLETMDSGTITASVLLRDGGQLTPPPNLDKAAFAAWLLDRLGEIRGAARAARGT